MRSICGPGQVASRGTRGDPCLVGRVLTYLNNPQVQKAMHANTTRLPFSWNFCLGSISFSFSVCVEFKENSLVVYFVVYLQVDLLIF